MLTQERDSFEKEKRIYESALLTFKGVDGYDVYNCSVPFKYKGKTHLYGRVEKREECANSHVRLFVETGKDEFTCAQDVVTFQVEDPFIARVNDEMVFGGTRVIKDCGKISNFYFTIYRGLPDHFMSYSSGPDNIRRACLVQQRDGRIGVFSGGDNACCSCIDYASLSYIEDLNAEAIHNAKPIDHTLFGDAWGGVNQAYLLDTGKIGCISHHGYLLDRPQDVQLRVYLCTSFVFDPETFDVHDFHIIGDKGCFPACEPKLPRLADCAFVSGIVMREDGKCDLYSGLGDAYEGRITIDYPFEGHGKIVEGQLDF